jgi:hypothetical protein
MHLPWKLASRKNLHPATLQVLTKTLEFKELQIWQSVLVELRSPGFELAYVAPAVTLAEACCNERRSVSVSSAHRVASSEQSHRQSSLFFARR